MTNKAQSPQVLVVGAGPTGLTAAGILAKHGIKVRIVDKNLERSVRSKAVAVQAGTLECLTQAFDPRIVQKLIEAGRPTRDANLHLDDRPPVQIQLSMIPSTYNYILVLAQSETERILEEHLNSLGVKVERGVELTSLDNGSEQVIATLVGPTPRTETLCCKFIIGCDGAHSAVRHALHAEFVGGQYQGDFILGDVKLRWPYGYDSVHAFVTKRGVIGAFPLKGERNYRLIMIPKDATEAPSSEIRLDEFRKILDRLSNNQFKIDAVEWLTRFRVSHRMVRSFHKNRVFLAGDAAHIHSPAGGQGMNTGIQDALNLGFKIKAVLAGGSMNLLQAYDKERVPVARNIVRATDMFSRAMLLPEKSFAGVIRRHLLPHLAGSGWIQRRMVRAISQIDIAHREIAGYEY